MTPNSHKPTLLLHGEVSKDVFSPEQKCILLLRFYENLIDFEHQYLREQKAENNLLLWECVQGPQQNQVASGDLTICNFGTLIDKDNSVLLQHLNHYHLQPLAKFPHLNHLVLSFTDFPIKHTLLPTHILPSQIRNALKPYLQLK